MQKISEWLSKNIDSHTIYCHEVMAAKFERETDAKCCWRSHTWEETRTMLIKRGLGGSLKPKKEGETYAWGYEMAEALARIYAQYDDRGIQGRGSRFRLAVETLEAIGS